VAPFYGYIGPRRPAEAWLLTAASEAPDRGGAKPGWGIAWIAGDEALDRQGEEPANDDPAFRAAAEEAKADAVVSTLAEPGQPVRFHRWLFALDGKLPALAGLREQLRDRIPDRIGGQLPLDTDAGLLLGMILTRLQAVAADGPPEPELLRAVVAQSLEEVATAASDAWSEERPTLGLALTNGRYLVAVRRGGALRWSPVTHGGVRIASRVSPDTKGWDALGPESIMSLGPDGSLESESLADAADRHRPPGEPRKTRRFGF
jgi:hypothetical protein